jgi:hypothetical protein
VGGKLAQLGGRLIDATARKLAGEFFSKLGEVVGPAPAEEAPERKPGILRRWLSILRRWFSRRKAASSEGEGGD